MSYLWAYIMGDTTIVFNIFFNVQNLDSMMLNAKYDCVLFLSCLITFGVKPQLMYLSATFSTLKGFPGGSNGQESAC